MSMKPRPPNRGRRPWSAPVTNVTTSGPTFRLAEDPQERGRRIASNAPGPVETIRQAGRTNRPRQEAEREQGIYVISVAARILEMHPQTLRKYERIGLVTPSRTMGMLRLYSEVDIARIKLIKHLVVDLGLNLAGVQLALALFNHLLDMRAHVRMLEGRELKSFLEESLDDMFALLHTNL